MTYLETINEVLRRLREDTVSTASESTYSVLVGSFVKQAYTEVCNAYNWPELQETQDVAITSSDTSFTITSGDSGEGVADVTSVYNTTDECFLARANKKWVLDKLSSYTSQNKPSHFAYGGETAQSTSTYHIYPTSDASYTLRVNFNRKPDLNNTFSDSTFLLTPELPVILRALSLAVSERGEDGGATSNEVDMMAGHALADAISLYESNNNFDNLSWVVV